MKFLSIDSVNKIYSFASDENSHFIYRVFHPGLQSFCSELYLFEDLKVDLNAEPFKTFTGLMRRYRFKICAAPLPFDHPAVITPETYQMMKRFSIQISSIQEDLGKKAIKLVDLVNNLSESGDNPVGDYLTRILISGNYGRTGLLMKDNSFSRYILKEFANHSMLQRVETVRIHQLRGGLFFDRLVVIGPLFWYPQHVVDAPRAAQTDVIHYDWLGGKRLHRPTFLDSNLGGSIKTFDVYGVKRRENGDFMVEPYGNVKDVPEIPITDSEAMFPSIDWGNIANGFRSRIPENETCQENADARLFSLSCGGYVFLDSSDAARAIIIVSDNLDDERDIPVRRIYVNEIEEGMLILIRTAGGGDLILPLADRILGEKASKAREMQSFWKRRLWNFLDQNGFQGTIEALISLGSSRANETNIRNWISSMTICPNDLTDFSAIMHITGLNDDVSEYWINAQLVKTAHRKAGHFIRRMLLKEVLRSDLDEIEKNDRIDFELEEGNGGKLTAFRVENVSPDTYEVPVSKLGHYFEQDQY